MTRLTDFIKRETVFFISAIAALITIFFTGVDKNYLGYIDFNVIVMLFCLMAAVAGFKKHGGFDLLSTKLLLNEKRKKYIPFVLVITCFFFSMLVTNDVALIAFVPLTIYMIKDTGSSALIYVVIMETLAANLGSLVTPIGNPQNLFLYHYYDLGIDEFIKITIPLGGISLLIIIIMMFATPKTEWEVPKDLRLKRIHKGKIVCFCFLFLVCILSVLKIIGYQYCLIIVIISIIVWDRKVFEMVDYWLLLTFINFFIISGNLMRIDSISSIVSDFIMGNELMCGVLISQFISNVPAAILLASFTENFKDLITGVNIGGLGTLIASLASLISFKYYSLAVGAQKRKYLCIFTLINVGIMIILVWIFS